MHLEEDALPPVQCSFLSQRERVMSSASGPGRYSKIGTCSSPFGNTEITCLRTLSWETRSLGLALHCTVCWTRYLTSRCLRKCWGVPVRQPHHPLPANSFLLRPMARAFSLGILSSRQCMFSMLCVGVRKRLSCVARFARSFCALCSAFCNNWTHLLDACF